MLLIDNITFLRKFCPTTWQYIKDREEHIRHENIRVETTKNEKLTIVVKTETGWNYLHSKYNPDVEAEKILSQNESYAGKHVFFYGIGLGYHVEEFIRRNPEVSFSIYEPNLEVFYGLLSHKKISDIANKHTKNIFVGEDISSLSQHLQNFINSVNEEVIFVILPSYERIFKEQTIQFIEEFRDKVFNKRAGIAANMFYEKWIPINSIINLPTTFKTPNILHELPQDFKGKPAILVAAGPSLDYEYENLRYIKDNGLAYIFSVGSSINSLIENNILPDAACTYDGSRENHLVFKKVVELGITNVPLIYGSIVGYETIRKYPGPLLNFLVARDVLAPLLLKREDGKKLDYVDNSKSIAIITLQLLYKLGFDMVVLVGQNLAYSKDRWYSKGIEYYGEISELQKKDAIVVKDVEDNDIYTNRGFEVFRKEMEFYVNQYHDLEVINTTKGGAKIAGTSYLSLEHVIAERLTKKQIVNQNWITKKETSYDRGFFEKQFESILEQQLKLENMYDSFENILEEMRQASSSKNLKRLGRLFTEFDRLFDKLQDNKVYLLLIQSMNTNHFETILKMFQELRFTRDQIAKAERVISEFSTYLSSCRADLESVKKLLESTSENMTEHMQRVE
ncbi:motility associated factor glycosyltransferase family protein [Brevibacillus fortis]|uniref:motility associated factor glycosyltransferase family protein n=1 Tax=Brevibacillus fortis TaxID=2126352 RepID=UPI0038FC5184